MEEIRQKFEDKMFSGPKGNYKKFGIYPCLPRGKNNKPLGLTNFFQSVFIKVIESAVEEWKIMKTICFKISQMAFTFNGFELRIFLRYEWNLN